MDINQEIKSLNTRITELLAVTRKYKEENNSLRRENSILRKKVQEYEDEKQAKIEELNERLIVFESKITNLDIKQARENVKKYYNK